MRGRLCRNMQILNFVSNQSLASMHIHTSRRGTYKEELDRAQLNQPTSRRYIATYSYTCTHTGLAYERCYSMGREKRG
jgi:hypothetical protein